ncbi:hypothetical protein [Novosphingobium sp. LASN5T]|uniref:hypothetical protein n=1 Tax=Novosphingobium sp. LASN5T TaxID=2491021 RepID=UPI000F5EBC92|nr:hypothetical protein [Novosphingobium sp. LASN5T]RQW44107.1 hypothetical protein EH199_10260 [Novosphingobium sp. LASN5T]
MQWQALKKFGEALATYPIEPDSPIKAQWGFNMLEGDDLILGIEIAPANKRGDLIARIEVAYDREPQQRVRASFMTNYPQLETFGAEIAGLMNAGFGEAVLTGS